MGVEASFNEELGVVLPEPVTPEPVTNSTSLYMLISTDQKMISICSFHKLGAKKLNFPHNLLLNTKLLLQVHKNEV